MVARLFLVLLAAVVCSNALANRPRGIYVILPRNDRRLDSELCWNDPNINGVLLRVNWSDIEKTPGSLDFSYFDNGIELCRESGKFAQLSINFGQGAPDWIYGIGVKPWYPIGERNNAVMPAPWDPVFQERIAQVIASLGARYGNIRRVRSVTMWVGGRGIETFFAQSPEDAAQLNAIGGPKIWIDAAEKIIDAYAAAFPHAKLYLACGVAYPDRNATTTEVANYLLNKYPRQGGLQSCALSAGYPSPETFPHTNLSMYDIQSIGLQMRCPVGRMQGDTLEQCLDNALNNGADWVQIYPRDPESDPGEQSIVNFNELTSGKN